MLRYYLVFAAILAATQSGCTSMSATMLTRDASNSFWTRKDGLKGVPITLKVPTQVKLTIFEKHYLTHGEDGRRHRLQLPYVLRDISQEFIYTEKIFTVDFKRPAAGNYNLTLDLTPDQYIQKLQDDVTDNTIEQATTLIGKLVPSGLFSGGFESAGAEDVNTQLVEIESVVAVGLFEVEDPEFEEKMASFINCHLNQANDAWSAPPSVSAVHRTKLSGFLDQSDVCAGDVRPDVPENRGAHDAPMRTRAGMPTPVQITPLTNIVQRPGSMNR